LALIAVLVIACHASQQLLRFANALRFNFEHELVGVSTSQCRSESTSMKNLDYSCLALSVRKAQIWLFGRLFHVLAACRSGKCPAFVGFCHLAQLAQWSHDALVDCPA
jgi:hypothetical protein